VVAAVESMGGIGAGEERAHLQGVGFWLGMIDKFSHKKVFGWSSSWQGQLSAGGDILEGDQSNIYVL
jgi:hypothetical protein